MNTHPAIAPAAGVPAAAGDAARPLLQLMLLYYWAWLYLRVLWGDTTESTLGYIVTVLPIALAAGVGLTQVTLVSLRQPGMPSPLPLLVFAAAAGVVALGRGDFPTLLSAGLIALTLVWLSMAPTRLSLKTVNAFFLASIAAGLVFYLAGLSDYGILPGQYLAGADRGIEWRVSLFPYVPESGFFALAVFLANQLLGTGPRRSLYMLAALYFLLLSGVRSALVALVLCEIYIFVASRRGHVPAVLKTTVLWLLLAVFLVSVAGSAILVLVPGIAEGPIGSYLFREAAANLTEGAVTQSTYRGWLWGKHLELFSTSPLVGLGTYDFGDLNPTDAMAAMGTGSESFFTSWLARVGLCFLPFVYYLVRLGTRSAAQPGALEGCVFVAIWVAMLAYGSFIAPYNFIFLLLFGLLLRAQAEGPPGDSAAPTTRD